MFTFNHFIIQRVFTLKAHERLKSRKVIEQLFREGKSFSYFPFRIIFLETEHQLSALQASFSVSKKNFKKAVDRNRIKRLMREAYRLQKNGLKSVLNRKHKNLAIFFIYTGKELPAAYDLVYQKIGGALKRLEGEV